MMTKTKPIPGPSLAEIRRAAKKLEGAEAKVESARADRDDLVVRAIHARTELGEPPFSFTDIAERAGVSRQYVARLGREAGRRERVPA